MIDKKITYIFCLLLLPFFCHSQEQPDSTKRFKRYFTPKPKLASFSYKGIADFKLNGESDAFGKENANVKRNIRRDMYLRVPCFIKNGTLIGVGLRYRHEKFRFSDINAVDKGPYRKFEDKGLRSAGVDILFQRKLDEDKKIQGNLGFRLNGDTYRGGAIQDFLKVSLFVLYKKKKNDRTEIGYGIAAGYDLGSPLVYPIFSYKRHLTKHLTLDLNLPKQARFMYGFSDKTFLSWTAEVSGASYRVERPLLEGYDRLEIRKSEFRTYLRLEREIHDWIWLGAEAGYNQYINFYTSEPRELRDNAIITFDTSPAPFFKVGIFFVPPKKIYDKMR